MDSSQLSPALYPFVAPLPIPVAKHLQLRLERTKRTSATSLQQVLLEEIRHKRESVYILIDAFIRDTPHLQGSQVQIPTAWLLQTLASYMPGEKVIPQQTLSFWHSRGLLQYKDYDSIASLLIARMIDTGERNWLPSQLEESERSWWCFTQASPNEPVLPTQITQLATLSTSTICWTPWAGAVWDSKWTPIHHNGVVYGAIRWAKGIQERSQVRYLVAPDDIALWDRAIAALALPGDYDILQTLALLTLQRFARSLILNNLL